MTVAQAIDPGMDFEILSTCPCAADDWTALKVVGLGDDIEFAKAVIFCLLIEWFQFSQVIGFNVLYVLQPVVEQAETLLAHCRLNTTAAVVPGYDDVFDF